MTRKLHKRVLRTVGPSFATSLEPLTHRRIRPAEVFSKGITMVDVHRNWLKWFNIVIVGGDSMVSLRRIIYLSPTISLCYKDIYFNSFFPRTARPWCFLVTECFPL